MFSSSQIYCRIWWSLAMHFHSTNRAANRKNSNKIGLASLTNSSPVRLDTRCTAILVQVFSLVKYILILLFKNSNSLGFLELIFSFLLVRSLHLRLCCLVSTCTISKTIIAFKEGQSSTDRPGKAVILLWNRKLFQHKSNMLHLHSNRS